MRSSRAPRMLLAAVAVSVVLPVPSLLASARAGSSETVSVPVSAASWFWRGQVGVIGSTGIAAPVAVSDPTVPGGDLAVSGPQLPAAAGSPAGPLDESYLAFDISEIPVGSVITSFTITLPVDPRGVSADPAGAAIIACAARSSWGGGESAAPYSGKPTDGCDAHSPKLTAGAGGRSYAVDIADIAQRWVEPNALNLGVAITDNPANSVTAYQVVFGPAASLAKLTATVTFRPPASGEAGPVVAPPAAGAAASSPGGTSSPGLVSVAPVGPIPLGLPPDVATEGEPSLPPVAPLVAAQVRPADTSTPPAGFWFALVLIMLLLGITSVVLADPNIPLGVIADRGVARVLRARRAAPHNDQEKT